MFKCEKCHTVYPNLNNTLVNPETEKEMIICRDCINSMLANDELDICVSCGEYITYSKRDDSLEKYGDFDECPCCGNDYIEGYTRIELMQSKSIGR